MRVPFLALTLTIGLSSHAQFNYPFPTQNAVWTQWIDHWSTGSWPPTYYGRDYYTYYMVETDTLINGSTYAQVFDHIGNYTAAIRDEEGRVLVVPQGISEEFLLYDFTIPAGVDTTLSVWLLWNLEEVEVQVRGEGPIGEDGRIVIQSGGYQWIEGIGCTAGLFMEPYVNVSGYGLGLHCMSVENVKYYPTTSAGSCEITNDISDRSLHDMRVFPNPAGDLMMIQYDGVWSGTARISVFDILGKEVRAEVVGRGTNGWQLDMGTLPHGVYTVHFEVGQEIMSHRVMVQR
ncbi:MAG: T9SS type A sorting domain-containing protein [Flavobacteriales bacterium]